MLNLNSLPRRGWNPEASVDSVCLSHSSAINKSQQQQIDELKQASLCP